MVWTLHCIFTFLAALTVASIGRDRDLSFRWWKFITKKNVRSQNTCGFAFFSGSIGGKIRVNLSYCKKERSELEIRVWNKAVDYLKVEEKSRQIASCAVCTNPSLYTTLVRFLRIWLTFEIQSWRPITIFVKLIVSLNSTSIFIYIWKLQL